MLYGVDNFLRVIGFQRYTVEGLAMFCYAGYPSSPIYPGLGHGAERNEVSYPFGGWLQRDKEIKKQEWEWKTAKNRSQVGREG